MKAIVCFAHGDMHISSPGVDRWEVCQCGGTGSLWEDPDAGRLVVAALDRAKVRVLGLNNHMLGPAIESADTITPDGYRFLHDIATKAPGSVFDESRAACWAVVFLVGATGDVRWADTDEQGAFERTEASVMRRSGLGHVPPRRSGGPE